MSEQPEQSRDEVLAGTVARERARVVAFVRSRLPDREEAEDILSDVFYELVVAHRLQKPIAHVSGWLFEVARNAIYDSLRKRKRQARAGESSGTGEGAERLKGADGGGLNRGDEPEARLLPGLRRSLEDAPEAAMAREALASAIERALGELPPEQREVFLAHECEGRSFREIAESTGVPLNTLLSRKRYAVRSLRKRLRSMVED